MKYDIIADNIIQWLKAYSKKSKTDGFVIGIILSAIISYFIGKYL